jgi:hypothetical protein
MNFGEFEALKKGLIKEIERSKDGHGVLMANESQEEMKAARETVDTTSYRGLVRQKKPAIPRRWLKSAMFSLLASVMIDWRKEREDAEDKDAEAVQMDGRQVVRIRPHRGPQIVNEPGVTDRPHTPKFHSSQCCNIN